MANKSLNQHPYPAIQHLYSLDAMRAVAALGVVLFHWSNFFYSGIRPHQVSKPTFPFYEILFPLYDKGLSVELFFILSGFMFFWLYAAPISAGKTTAWNFGVLRFSRLYPLHLVTLLAVLAGQMIRVSQIGQPFMYRFNDPYHFVLNIFFASSWGLEQGQSFNAPIWSVSVQVLLYILFFVICFFGKDRPRYLSVLVLAGFVVIFIHARIGTGMFSFFLGGLVAHYYNQIVASGKVDRWVKPLTALMLSGWVLAIADEKFGPFVPELRLLQTDSLAIAGQVITLQQIPMFSDFLVIGILFPLTIMTLAVLGTRFAGLGRRLAFLGNLSYSTYVLHFPLQLAFVVIGKANGVRNRFYLTDASLLLFLSVLFILSLLSYRFFELPVQEFLRRKLLRGSPKLKPAKGKSTSTEMELS